MASESSDTWSIVEDSFDVAHNRHYEALMAIGSGPLQQRASLEEGLSDDPQGREYLRLMSGLTTEALPEFKGRVGTFMPGISGPHPTCGNELINLPALHGLLIYANHERLDMLRSRVADYRRQLDLRTGRLVRAFIWHTQRGASISVRFERFISARRRHVMALRCRLRHVAGPPAELRLVGTLDADIRTNGFDHFESLAFTGEHEPITVEVRTNGGDLVAAAVLMTCEPGLVSTVETEPRWAGISGVHVLDPMTELTVCKFAAMTSSRHVQGPPLDAARNLVWNAAAAGFQRLAEESDQVWQRRWEQTDVVIEGDPRSQLGLRVSLYHLLRAAAEHDSRVTIDPTAASSESCCGRYSWSADIFMLPMFLYTRPEVARVLAGFRLNSLDGARRNARRSGYAGARYAWESAPTGDEHGPNRQHAEHAVHVTADVAYSLWHAYLVSGNDPPFLARVTEVLTETARYWSQRVTYYRERDEYQMLGVMGPDEYSPFSRNNAYTNYLTATVLSLTGESWSALRTADPDAAEQLRAELGLTDEELARFAEIAGKLRLPYDADRRLVLQSDDFFDFEPLDFARWWPDRSQPLARSASRERLYRSRVLSQADVLQLMALFPHQFDVEQMRVAYDTYTPLTSHDSSLSRPIHAILAAWIGKQDQALRFWDESLNLDLTPPAADDGIHAACAGGNWQAAIFGFAGVRTRAQSEVLHIDPHLPTRWSALRFPLIWRGQALYVSIEPARVTVEHCGEQSLEARIFGKPAQLRAGQTHAFNAST